MVAARAAAAALAAGALGCGREHAAPLRLGMNLWPGYELLYLAEQDGLFAAAGVPTDVIEFGSLSDSRRAYERGQLDALATTLVEVLIAREASGRDLRVIGVLDVSLGGDMIIAGPTVASVADLRGKRVGVELASLGIYLLGRALERAGATLADVRLTSRDQRAMHEALTAGELDAVVTYPPEALAILAEPGFRTIFSSADLPGEVIDVLAVDGAWLAANPGAAARLLDAYARAHAVLAAEPERAIGVMARREGVAPDVFRGLLTDGMRLATPDEQAGWTGPGGSLRAIVERTAGHLRAAGLLGDAPRLVDCVGPP